ncbi:hypothetical protein [Paenibacillus alginolyticus]|uniref:Site-specific integrase n=1 Tax=Paenibacillus alginolyticus TaxID=59839 RepID=A0ABT4GEC3_9BACL|nr:hypothetical protein [Paenibacillus alginolyticus]MCY9694545.1 hypothetical protein [Paenibacillus alginolyticus]MEC0142706.1 hypothetical protein [Paenibacillus alginolyticus]
MHPNKNFVFVTREVKTTIANGRTVSYMSIALQDKRDQFLITHPVTDFIRSRYAGLNNNNTQKAPAEAIKRFLNWLLIEQSEKYELKSYEDLGIHHGKDYLEHLGMVRNNKRSTVMAADRYLTEFYYFLHKKRVIPIEIQMKRNMAGNEVPVSPFIEAGVSFPEEDKAEITKITDFPDLKLIPMFIDTAIEVAPEIAFGIYVQLFGGVRKGEVVNLSRGSIIAKGSYGSKGLKLIIKDRPELFNRLSDLSKNRVKSPRTQPVQVISTLPILYKHLLERLDQKKSGNPAQPLFLDENNDAMSGAVYEKRFKRVKDAFINKLTKMNSPHLHLIKKYNWSTHIGRGIYTNLMARFVKSPMELALLRGDKSLDAALRYMSLMRVINEVHQGLEDMYNSTAIDRLKRQYNDSYSDQDSQTSNMERETLSGQLIINL